MANCNLVIEGVLESIAVNQVYDTYHFGDANHVQKSSQIICKFLQGIIRDRQRLVRLTVSEHIRRDDTIARLNPWANLMSPAIPIHSSIRGLDNLSAPACHTRDREIRVPRAG